MDPISPTPPPSIKTANTTPVVKRKGSLGDLFGIVVIVGLVIVGAFYLLGERMAANNPQPSPGTIPDTGAGPAST